MTFTTVVSNACVRDETQSVEWYTTFFGRPADAKPMDHLHLWVFEGGHGFQIWLDPERAGKSDFVFGVESLEDETARLTAKGFHPKHETGAPGDKVRTATYTDLEGNLVTLVESEYMKQGQKK